MLSRGRADELLTGRKANNKDRLDLKLRWCTAYPYKRVSGSESLLII